MTVRGTAAQSEHHDRVGERVETVEALVDGARIGQPVAPQLQALAQLVWEHRVALRRLPERSIASVVAVIMDDEEVTDPVDARIHSSVVASAHAVVAAT